MSNARPYTVGYVTSPHPHGPFHIRTLEVLAEVEAVHLCGIEGEDLGAMVSRSSKVASTTTDLDELLARPEVDPLLVCVRNDLCPHVLEAAVKAGKGVLFEKPGATNAADLRRVADLARERGVTMAAMFQNRFSPMASEVRRAVRDGALGRVMAVEARMVTSQVRYRDPSMWIFAKDTAGSGILGWLGCHYIDLLCYLLEDRIVEVTAIVGSQNPENVEVEDTACLAFRFAGGALGTMQVGYLLPGSAEGYSGASYDTFLALRGTDGYVRIPEAKDGAGYTLLSLAPGWESEGPRERVFADEPQSEAYGGVGGERLVLDFLEAAQAGTPAPVTIEDAVHVLEVIGAALESSATGRAVRVGE